MALGSIFLRRTVRIKLSNTVIDTTGVLPLTGVRPRRRRIYQSLVCSHHRFSNSVIACSPLAGLAALFRNGDLGGGRTVTGSLPVSRRLGRRVVSNRHVKLRSTLTGTLRACPPLRVVGAFLLSNVGIINRLFNSNRVRLPFILRSTRAVGTTITCLRPCVRGTSDSNSNGNAFVVTAIGNSIRSVNGGLISVVLSGGNCGIVGLNVGRPIRTVVRTCHRRRTSYVTVDNLLIGSATFVGSGLRAFGRRNVAIPIVLNNTTLAPGFIRSSYRGACGNGIICNGSTFSSLRFVSGLVPTGTTKG